MRLFVNCPHCRNNIYFNSPARTRNELPFNFVLKCAQINCPTHGQDITFYSNEVQAEVDRNGGLSGALILGGLGGIMGGPVGAVIGGLIGLKAGSNSNQEEILAVERFNNS